MPVTTIAVTAIEAPTAFETEQAYTHRVTRTYANGSSDHSCYRSQAAATRSARMLARIERDAPTLYLVGQSPPEHVALPSRDGEPDAEYIARVQRHQEAGDVVWSGRMPVPAIGDLVICNDRHATRVTVTGWRVAAGWLMVTGYRTNEPAKRGDLSGAEIRYLGTVA